MNFVISKMLDEQQSRLEALSAKEMTVLSKSIEVMKQSEQLVRMYQMSLKNPNQFIAFLRKFRILLQSVQVGDSLFVPGGFNNEAGFSPFLLILERKKKDIFNLAVINTAQVKIFNICLQRLKKVCTVRSDLQ